MTAYETSLEEERGTDRLPSQTVLALEDIIKGFCRWHLWALLGWQDIKQRYRRSFIGPFWLTISMGALIGALGFLYAAIFGMDISKYLPHIAVGFIVWTLIQGILNDGCLVFISSEQIIKQIKLPYSVHAYRAVCRNAVIFAHNSIIYLIVVVIFDIRLGFGALYAVLGLLFILLNGAWASIFLGLLSSRFRDLTQIVASAVQLVFFMTPIIWLPETLNAHHWILLLNPFFHFIELVRLPLMGGGASLTSWVVVLVLTCVGWMGTFCVLRYWRRRIAYWV